MGNRCLCDTIHGIYFVIQMRVIYISYIYMSILLLAQVMSCFYFNLRNYLLIYDRWNTKRHFKEVDVVITKWATTNSGTSKGSVTNMAVRCLAMKKQNPYYRKLSTWLFNPQVPNISLNAVGPNIQSPSALFSIYR